MGEKEGRNVRNWRNERDGSGIWIGCRECVEGR